MDVVAHVNEANPTSRSPCVGSGTLNVNSSFGFIIPGTAGVKADMKH